jgi:hypothetical protein
MRMAECNTNQKNKVTHKESLFELHSNAQRKVQQRRMSQMMSPEEIDELMLEIRLFIQTVAENPNYNYILTLKGNKGQYGGCKMKRAE